MKTATTLRSARAYVDAYLEERETTINQKGEVFWKGDPEQGEEERAPPKFDFLHLDYMDQVSDHNDAEKLKLRHQREIVIPAAESLLLKAFTLRVALLQHRARQVALEPLICTREDLSLVKRFVNALTGYDDEDTVAVMAHWLWCVKMKINHRIPDHHVMPILYGRQGAGKTVAIDRLLGPIERFRLNFSLEQILDPKCFQIMADNYVVVFEELQGAKKADIDALKRQLTAVKNDYRTMYAHASAKVQQACSFIGSTNRPVGEQIRDSTGMRRFWQIDCQDQINWQVISELDYLALWQGIDEKRPHGYLPARLASIKVRQQGLVEEDPVEVFLKERGANLSARTREPVITDHLYIDYKDWAQLNGEKPISKIALGKKLAALGLKSRTRTIEGKTYNTWELPDGYKRAITGLSSVK